MSNDKQAHFNRCLSLVGQALDTVTGRYTDLVEIRRAFNEIQEFVNLTLEESKPKSETNEK